jgi:hypothetical protein
MIADVDFIHHGGPMIRRQFLSLGAVATGTFAVGGLARLGRRVASAQGTVPTVDRLVLTNVVDNVYNIFAKGGKLDTVTVHCSGINTIMAVHREMPAKLIMPSTGTRVIFGG